MHEHGVTGRRKGVQSGHHAAQDAVLVANVARLEVTHALAVAVPVNDGLVVGITRVEVTKRRVLETLLDGARNRGGNGKVHVRDPHGDGIKALIRSGIAGAGRADGVHGDGIVPGAVEDRGEVVGHGRPFVAVSMTAYAVLLARSAITRTDCNERYFQLRIYAIEAIHAR